MSRIFLVVYVLAFLIGTTSGNAAKRVALVIGNSQYINAPALANPINDATDIAAKLKFLRFEVVEGIDLNFRDMRKTIREFIGSLEGAEIALFYYAGHGLQVGGKNYMAPIDARLANENDLEFEAVPMSIVLSAMEQNTGINLVLLDACRNNPLAGNLARSMGTRSAAVGQGLALIGSGVGTMISFATQPGNVALDGTGRNSPFTKALLKHLGNPGEGLTHSMIRVRRDVLQATQGKQVPWDNSSLTGDVVLQPATGDENQANKWLEEEKKRAETTYWQSIVNSDDKAFFEAYLARYPNGEFTDIAVLNLKNIVENNDKKLTNKPSLSNAIAKSGKEVEFDRSQLARLDPNSKGIPDEDSQHQLTPVEYESQLGLQPEDYQRIQVALSTLGYDVGATDGAFGPILAKDYVGIKLEIGLRRAVT